jgi:hypothetical protein
MHLYARQALSRTRTADEDRPSHSFGWQPVLCVSNLLLCFRRPLLLSGMVPQTDEAVVGVIAIPVGRKGSGGRAALLLEVRTEVPEAKRLRGVAQSASVLTRVRVPRRVLAVVDALVHAVLHRLQVAGRRADAHQQSDGT